MPLPILLLVSCHLLRQSPLLDAELQWTARYWATPINCAAAPEQQLITPCPRYSPALSILSSPIIPSDYYDFNEELKMEEIEDRMSSLSEVFETPAATPMSPSPSITPIKPHIFNNPLEQKMKLMEEKTKLIRQRVPRRGQGKDQPTCPTCEKTFTRSQNLKTHMQRHEDEPERPFACGQCPLRFKRTADLMRHQDSVRSFRDRDENN
jgi:uncharacterized Zn-finger protein